MRALILLTSLVMAGTASAQLAPAPEAATGRRTTVGAVAERQMVAAANPLAAAAGRDILRAGGSAVDAAIAIQLVLNVVEPQSSGIGGGAFLLHWDGRSVVTLDGRETAPAAATQDRFLLADGRPMPFRQAVVGGRSVGVPGVVRLMEDAHRRWGRLPWERLFAPAIALAEQGFPVSPRLAGLLAQETALAEHPPARRVFYTPEGRPLAVGDTLRQPDLAATFRRIATEGAAAFYAGAIADGIVATVTGHPSNPGDMTLADLASYRTEERAPVCGSYRVYRICGMGPPSSGGIAVQQILTMLERVDLRRTGPGAEAAHWMSEAGRLAFADRNLYVADPAFADVPVRGLLDRDYLAGRAGSIDPVRSMGRAVPGMPPGRRAERLGLSDAVENGTSHISVVDRDGHAVAMTTTIEASFGSRLLAPGGFLLNNQLTDFDFVPVRDDRPVANRVAGGKRPRSSMAPTLVFDRFGRLYAVLGSPGGSQIILYVAKTVVALLDWRMDPQAAVDHANFGSRNGPTELERGTEAEGWAEALRARGHEVQVMDMTSGAQAILVTPEGLLGGGDGRREGVALGD